MYFSWFKITSPLTTHTIFCWHYTTFQNLPGTVWFLSGQVGQKSLMRWILLGFDCVSNWSKSACSFKDNYKLDSCDVPSSRYRSLTYPVGWGTPWSADTQAYWRDILPFDSRHLPLASWQVEWKKLLCTLTGCTRGASWAAFLISPCPPITTFPSWKTPWMGKTSTLVEPSNTSWLCPRDRTFYPEKPGGSKTLPDTTHRGTGTRCVSFHQGASTPWWETRTKTGVPGWPFLLTFCGPNPTECSV